MSFSLLIRPEARSEIESAFDWYQSRRAGLGFEFERCLERCLEPAFARILRDPESYAGVVDDVRRVPVRRFPYGVFYRVAGQQVAIIAVYHSHRGADQIHERP